MQKQQENPNKQKENQAPAVDLEKPLSDKEKLNLVNSLPPYQRRLYLIISETIQEEDPLILMKANQQAPNGALLLKMHQVDEAMELKKQLEREPIREIPGGIEELVRERLLDYPGRPMDHSDPTLVDREQMRMFDMATKYRIP